MKTHSLLPPLSNNVLDAWNEEKKAMQEKIRLDRLLSMEDRKKKRVYINEREVWYMKLGQNLGSESNGKKDFRRPVLVIKKVGSMFFVAPMTTKGKDDAFHHQLQHVTYNLEAYGDIPPVSRVQLSQVRIVDRARFLERIATVSESDFSSTKKKLSELLLGASCANFPSILGDPEGHL